MSRISIVIGLTVLIALGVVLGRIGWTMYRETQSQACHVCQRPIHSINKTIAQVDGEDHVFCCPTCTLTVAMQGAKGVEIVELTDFSSGVPLSPKNALIVEGSSYNPCVEHTMLMDQVKQTSPMDFDRCSPSMVAFADKDAAYRFVREKGGTVLPFSELQARIGR